MIAESGYCVPVYNVVFNSTKPIIGTGSTASPLPNARFIKWTLMINSTTDNTALYALTLNYTSGITNSVNLTVNIDSFIHNLNFDQFNCIEPPTYSNLNVSNVKIQRTLYNTVYRFMVNVVEKNIDFSQKNNMSLFGCNTNALFTCLVKTVLNNSNTLVVSYYMDGSLPSIYTPYSMNITFRWTLNSLYLISFDIPVFTHASSIQSFSLIQYPNNSLSQVSVDFWALYPVVQFIQVNDLGDSSPHDRFFYSPDCAAISPSLGNSSGMVYASDSTYGVFNSATNRTMFMTTAAGYLSLFTVSKFNVSLAPTSSILASMSVPAYKQFTTVGTKMMGFVTFIAKVTSPGPNPQLFVNTMSKSKATRYPQPFGVTNNTQLGTLYNISLPVSLASQGPYNIQAAPQASFVVSSTAYPSPSSSIPSPAGPLILDIQFIARTPSTFFLVVDFMTDTRVGLSSISYNLVNYSTSYLVSGNLYLGKLSIPIDCFNPIQANDGGYPTKITIVDNFGNYTSFNMGGFVTTSRQIPLIEPCSDAQLLVSNITSIQFIPNNIDTSIGPTYVSMLFNLSTPTPSLAPTITFYLQNISTNPTQQYRSIKVQSYFDNILNQFRADLTIPQRLGNESINYFINSNVYSSTLIDLFGEQARLQVYSNYMDKLPPYITNITAINPTITLVTDSMIGFDLTIQDDYNGFDYGQLNVTSDRDQQVYSIWFTSSQGVNGVYRLQFNVTVPCVKQTFSVKELVLVDKAGWVSYAPLLQPYMPPTIYSTQSSFNSFYRIINQPLPTTTITCLEVIDTTPPTIVDFSTSTQVVDIGGIDRTVSFTVTAIDSGSGISTRINPIIYLLDDQFGMVTVPVVSRSYVSSNTVFLFQTQIPYGVGNNGLLVSMYGLMDNNLNIAYCTTNALMSASQVYMIRTTFTQDQPVITGSTSVPRAGGQVTLFTRGIAANTMAVIYLMAGDGGVRLINAVPSVAGVLVFNTNTNVTGPTISVYLTTTSVNTTASNTWMIPVVDYITIYTPPPPLSCPGTPQCGGPSKGVCTANGCQCLGQWYGPDCTSFTITVDKPNVTTTNPTVTIGGGDIVSSIKSIVSIYSIRELGIDGSTVLEYKFKNWTFNNQSQSDSTQYLYSSLIDSTRTTTLNVTIQWFKQSTNLTFAGDQIYLPPSSTKITLSLSSYQFQNELNSLQILMDVELVDENKGGCSSTSYGTGENGDNNDIGWVKIRTGDTSVYARFIRKGIVDTRLTSISNSIITLSESSSTRSFVGVNVPHFTTSVILDPDISMLLEQDSIQCSSQSGFTNAQLAGIIVASVAAGLMIVVLSIIVIKKRYRFIRRGAVIKMVSVH